MLEMMYTSVSGAPVLQWGKDKLFWFTHIFLLVDFQRMSRRSPVEILMSGVLCCSKWLISAEKETNAFHEDSSVFKADF